MRASRKMRIAAVAALLLSIAACDRGRGLQGAKGEGVKGADMTEKAMFAAGCFWGVEELFRKVEGVTGTAVGYSGGSLEDPTYEDVCTDKTGHAEAVLVEYDPSVVSYDALLGIFWANHDPTTPNRQGPDVGSQYRSAIFYYNEDQRRAAEESRRSLAGSGKLPRPIVTEIVPAGKFWKAEEYHQKYLMKRGADSCSH